MQATDPTSTTRNKSSDQATIFVSLELSRAVWLVTALVRGATRRCRAIRCQAAIWPGC
jgi:hypothetical protein